MELAPGSSRTRVLNVVGHPALHLLFLPILSLLTGMFLHEVDRSQGYWNLSELDKTVSFFNINLKNARREFY